MKLLYAGDTPTVTTGFGLVAKNLLNRLNTMGYDITVLGVNHYGLPYDQQKFPYPIYPNEQGGPEQVFGFHKFWGIYEHVKPDIVLFLNDPWLIDSYMKAKPERTLPHTKLFAYYPTDASPIKPEWLKTLNSLSGQVCYSHYAEDVIRKSNGGEIPENLHQIYHGVDTKTFFPVNQNAARNKLGIPNDLFIVGMVARNQFRKRFDILLAGFVEFAKDKPDARLYMHTALDDIGYDIADLVRQFDIAEKIILTEDITPAQGVSDDRLNLIYNSFDVNALISLGDGFGLPVAESMATGCPQLVSDHSCLKELVDGHGGLTVKTDAWILNTNGINTWGGISSYKDIAEKLDILYNNKELRLKLSEQGYNYITQDQFNWDHIVQQWDRLFKDALHIL